MLLVLQLMGGVSGGTQKDLDICHVVRLEELEIW